MVADGRASNSRSSSTWLGEPCAMRATLSVGKALGAQGIMSAQPPGAQGRLQESDLGVAGAVASVLREGEPPLSGIARGPCMLAMPGMSGISPSRVLPAFDTHVNPLPTSVSWPSNRMTRNTVARRRRVTMERYRRTTRVHRPESLTSRQDTPASQARNEQAAWTTRQGRLTRRYPTALFTWRKAT